MSALRTLLSLALVAHVACGDSGQKDQHDAESSTGDEKRDSGVVEHKDAGHSDEDDDAGTSERDAGGAASDSGTRPMDASVSSDAGNAKDAGRDAALDAGADSGGGLMIGPPAHTFVYVGGYSNDGLRMYELNRTSFALTAIAQDAAVGPNPTYLTPSANGRMLYVANEDDSAGGITVLRLDDLTSVPMRVDHEDAISSGFVFSSLSPDGKYLLASSYNGGNVAVYPVDRNGLLGPRVDARDFGNGAQSHSVRVHASGKWAYVPNKGLDGVAQLKFDATTGKLSDNSPATFAAQPSAQNFDGPRHIAFSRDGKFAFVVLENGNLLFSLRVDDTNGTLSEADRKPREAEADAAGSTGAHVLAHPKKNFVYASNRVSNTLAAFSYDEQGKLTLIGRVPSHGNTPRDFDIDPLGDFLIVANQDSGSVAVFSIEADGSLIAKGNPATGLDGPAAVAIVPQN